MKNEEKRNLWSKLANRHTCRLISFEKNRKGKKVSVIPLPFNIIYII